ncbi:MAG: hypothetical protein P0120_07555 [Nitrospira sp.]|nr:hypothetical protein [Nitrospira sp.]
MLLVLFLLVALWQGTVPSMARSDESPASTVPRTLIQNAGLLITMDPTLGEGPLGTLANADLLFAGDSIVAVGKGLSADDAAVIDATSVVLTRNRPTLHSSLSMAGPSGPTDSLPACR